MSKKKGLALEERLGSLVRANRLQEAAAEFAAELKRRPGKAVDIYTAYTKALLGSGLLREAEPLLVEGLQHDPQSFPLLYMLGQVDENGGSNLGAFDLYTRADAVADTSSRKKAIGEALERIRTKVSCRILIEDASYSIVMDGNPQPVVLDYNLQEMAVRRSMLDFILQTIDPKAKTVLELECGPGIISKNLAGHGFQVSGVDAGEENIMRATVFEQVEMLRMTGYPTPAYSCFDLDAGTLGALDKSDVIMLLPSGAGWYEKRGPEEAANLLKQLLKKSRKQLYFFLPASLGEDFSGALLVHLQKGSDKSAGQVTGSKQGKGEEAVLCADIGGAGRLYRIDRRQAGEGNLSRLLPCNLEAAGSRSLIFTVEVAHCRSLNGFAYTEEGWNHFTAALREVRGSSAPGYGDSILKRFFELFQPRNRQEHLFGAGAEPLPPLDGGFTLLPWMETKNRPVNSPEAPLVRGGNHHFGPNSDHFGEQEYAMLKNTGAMLFTHGYRPEIFPDGYIQGYFLKDGEDYRFIVTEGQHRMAAIGLLGEKTIKARFDLNWLPIVDRARLENWPQVKTGLYCEAVAEKVFRYYFEEDGRRKAKQIGLL